MRAKTVAILAVVVFLLGGAIGALYAVLNSNTPSNDKLPVSSYSDLENNKDKDAQTDNQQTDDQNNTSAGTEDQQTNNDANTADNSNEANNSTVSPRTENKVGEVNVREDSALSLRQGPGTNYERIGNVYRGDRLDILDEQNGWYKVKTYDGVEAWASAEYIEIVE